MDQTLLKLLLAVIYGSHCFVCGQNLSEGDMVFPQGDSKVVSSIRNGYVSNPRYLWPAGQVYFNMSKDIRSNNGWRENLTTAMDDIESYSCVTFHDINDMVAVPNDYVDIGFIGDKRLEKSGAGCWSSVGRQGGRQVLNLEPPQCFSLPVIKHELMHVLAFVHEQNRFDRNDYVKINYENIDPTNHVNFKKREDSYDDEKRGIHTSLTPYDYHSIMHYGRKDFSENGQDTITPIDSPIEHFGGEDLSIIDIKELNDAYGCNLSQDLRMEYAEAVIGMLETKVIEKNREIISLKENLGTCQTKVVTKSKPCQYPAPIKNGEFVCIDGDTRAEAICYLQCQDGFVSSEGEMAECVAGRWQSKGNGSLACEEGVAILVGGKGVENEVELYSTGGDCNQRLKTLPGAREGHSTVWWEGEVVTCGGKETDVRETCYKAFRRHGEEDWELHSNLLGRRRYHTQVAVAGKIFQLGGDSPDSRNSTEVFSDGKWSKLPSGQQFGRGACTVKDSVESLIISGGRHSNKQVWRYNVLSNTWTKLPDMLSPRYHHACITVTVGRKKGVLVAGGDQEKKGTSGTSEFFSLEDNGWEMKGSPKTERTGASMVVVGGSSPQVLLMGGFNNNGDILNSVEEFNTETGDWIVCDETMRDARGYFSTVAAPVGRFRNCNIV